MPRIAHTHAGDGSERQGEPVCVRLSHRHQAVGACSGNGILLVIRDPKNPVRLDQVTDKAFAYWHSATFNNDGTKVLFTDEWGGGGRPRCRTIDPPTWGADAIFDIVDRKLKFA